MRGKKPGDKLSNSPDAVRKRRQRERAAQKRAQETEADPGEAEEPEAEPETEPETPTEAEAELPLPPGARPEFGSPHVPSFEPLGDAAPPPGLSVREQPRGTSSTTRSASSATSRDTEWHRKWKAQLAGGGGREEFCEFAADKAIGLLSKLDDIIRACGQTPMVTAESLRPAAVLTIDQMMPTSVSTVLEKPFAHLAFGVLAISGQAVGAISQAKAKVKRGEVVTPQPKAPPPKPVTPLRSVPPQGQPQSDAPSSPSSPSSPPPTAPVSEPEQKPFQFPTGVAIPPDGNIPAF